MGTKLGVCFTGGGARGSYQIGALKAIEEKGLLNNVSAFSGTSIGAANAAVVASQGVKEAYEVWLNLPEDTIPRKDKTDDDKQFHFDINEGIFSMDVFDRVMMNAVDYNQLREKEVYATISEGGSKQDGLLELLKRSFDYYVKNQPHVRYLPLHTLDDEEIHKGIVASCSIPIVFSPVVIEGQKYYDGGVFDNTPVRPLVENGCDEIIVLHLHKDRSQVDKEEYPNVIFHEIRHDKVGELGHILKFSTEQAKKLYQYGYEDAMKYFKNNDVDK